MRVANVLSSEKSVVFLFAEIRLQRLFAAAVLFFGGTMEETKVQELDLTQSTIMEAIKALDYGTVTVTIHDGKPVMLEVSKKVKL